MANKKLPPPTADEIIEALESAGVPAIVDTDGNIVATVDGSDLQVIDVVDVTDLVELDTVDDITDTSSPAETLAASPAGEEATMDDRWEPSIAYDKDGDRWRELATDEWVLCEPGCDHKHAQPRTLAERDAMCGPFTPDCRQHTVDGKTVLDRLLWDIGEDRWYKVSIRKDEWRLVTEDMPEGMTLSDEYYLLWSLDQIIEAHGPISRQCPHCGAKGKSK